MIDPNAPAYPQLGYRRSLDGIMTMTHHEGGLTLRQHFASMAMQGLLAGQPISDLAKLFGAGIYDRLSIHAVICADALIQELSKAPPTTSSSTNSHEGRSV